MRGDQTALCAGRSCRQDARRREQSSDRRPPRRGKPRNAPGRFGRGLGSPAETGTRHAFGMRGQMSASSGSAVLDLAALEAWGRRLGVEAYPGLVVELTGPLGAGKTTLVRAIVDGAGGNPAAVASPTFVLMQEHQGRFPIVHIDVYRLKIVQEFLDLGVDEIIPTSLCLIEWAERV